MSTVTIVIQNPPYHHINGIERGSIKALAAWVKITAR